MYRFQISPIPLIFLSLCLLVVLVLSSFCAGFTGFQDISGGLFPVGIEFQNGIFAGTIDRAFLMLYTFIFGIGSLIYIWIRLAKANKK